MKAGDLRQAAENFFDRLNRQDETARYVRIPLLIISNWLFQGLFYMDRTERLFKVGLDLIGVAALYLLLCHLMGPVASLTLAFFVIHTANWALNGQVFGLFKKFGLVYTPEDVLERACNRIADSAACDLSIEMVLEYGSCARGEGSTSSDIDLRVLRSCGKLNGLKACKFALQQRMWAFINKIPLDIYVFDSHKSLARMGADETPRILYDKKS